MFENIKAVVFDLDGTIYHGKNLIPGADKVVEHFRKLNKQVFFLTNNSTRTRQIIFERLTSMGVNCTLNEVFTSGYMAQLYFKENNLQNNYIVGTDYLKEEFRKAGVPMLENEEDAENLLIGFIEDLNYDALSKAFRAALHAKKIIVTNIDRYYPGTNGVLYPGCGSFVKAIEYSANRNYDFIIGKPNTYMLDKIAELHQLNAEDILVVGDVYDSDILMAKRKGSPSVLIGNTDDKDVVCISDINELIHLTQPVS